MTPTGTDLFSFGAMLKAFRKRRRLTQQALAALVGVHRNTISIWERGDYLPESKTLVLEVAHQLSLAEQETRQLLEASLTALAPHWLVPLPRNPLFTGREATLEALHTQLGVNRTVALAQSLVLHGLGGVGKTQIALEYAYRYALSYSAVFWIGAETDEQIVSSLLRIARALQLLVRDDKDQQRVIAVVQHWLTTHSQWLLIWDNLEAIELLHHFWPLNQQGAMLITTRRQALGTLVRGIDLEPMEQEEGILFLLRRAKVLEPEAPCEHMQQFAVNMPGEYAAATELVTTMAAHPLALDQAGAYIDEIGCSLAGYLQRYKQNAHLLDQRGAPGDDHPQSVTTTFRLLLERVEREQRAAADVLRVCAFLHAEAIPEELFVEGAAHLGPALEPLAADPFRLDQTLATLRNLSLVRRHPETNTLSLHRLVQVVLCMCMSEQEQAAWLRRIIVALNTVFPEVTFASTSEVVRQCRRFFPHILVVAGAIPDQAGSQSLIEVLRKAAGYLCWGYPQHEQTEALYQRALRVGEQTLEPQHSELATTLHGLASLYRTQGKYEQVEPLYQRALRITEQAVGSAHPWVADQLDGLANLYAKQGKQKQAEPLYERALRIQEQHLGQNHPKAAQTLHDLAILRRTHGKLSEALSLVERALLIRSQSLGDAHPKTVATRTLYAQPGQEQTGVTRKLASEWGIEGFSNSCGKACQAERASLLLGEADHPSPSEDDPVQEFLTACCELHPLAWCRVRDLWHTYEHWTASCQGRIPLSRRAFAVQLKVRGCRVGRTSTARIWRGIRLVKTSS